MLLDELPDLRRGHRASLTRHLETVSEQHHGWDRSDTKTTSQAGNLFGVYLCQNELTGRFLRHFPELRRHHFAWAAPRRPKIHQHGHCRSAYQRVKNEIIVNIDRFTDRPEFRLTLAASENFAEAFVSHPVTAAASWAVQ
jgi:hypothetical protein